MQQWKTLSKKLVLADGKYLTVEHHEIELPNGRIISPWPWLITPDYVNVAVVTQEKTFLCFRQTKYGVEGTTLAPVGGYLEPGEDPLSAARRELLEESGYEASDWKALGRYCVDGNRGAGTAYLFLAENALKTAEPSSDDLEEQQLLHLTYAEVKAALAAGEFKVLAWATVISLSLLYLDRRFIDGE
jgi:ADP-ribose pyrophosphatase